MRQVVLMPEYCAPPLWTDKGPVTPQDLGLSPALSQKIFSWAHEWEYGGGEKSSEADFIARGNTLASEIQVELGPSATVRYEV